MIARLILALLLAAFAMPAGASVPACHDTPPAAMATHAMPDMPAVPDHKAAAAHVCIGCIPPSDWVGGHLGDRLRPGAANPVAGVMRLDLGAGCPPPCRLHGWRDRRGAAPPPSRPFPETIDDKTDAARGFRRGPAAARRRPRAGPPGHDDAHAGAPPLRLRLRRPPAPAPAPTPASMPMDHASIDHGAMAMPDTMAMPAMTMGMGGDAYQQGSGTARLPAAEGMMRGRMFHAGDWMLMAHGYVWGVTTGQNGPRGDNEAFVESMAMLMADRDIGPAWHLQLRSMVSLEPLMGARGYPNLFATGEVADGRPLVDRQHPHDLFMELAARLDYRLADDASLFLYGGPVGEPALGPSAFMHRGSARYMPMSPITHHWFDSTHITYGVVTAGYATRHFQLEGSVFKGREPDEYRWNIESPRLDSWSVRGSWTPSPDWALQVSHGRLNSPEEQHPGEDEARTTASVQYAHGGVATTFAYALKRRLPGPALSAFLAEATWEIDRHHAIFGRVENVANDELFPNEADPLHDRRFRVTKAEAGYAYRVPISGPFGVALGGTVAAYAKPAALDAAYGDPVSWTLFAKFALGL